MTAPPGRLAATYVLPLKATVVQRDLGGYLGELASITEVVVVDASPPPVFAAHAAAWPDDVVHVAVDGDLSCAMGKVAGVLTGLRRASHEAVVIADDDVRYTAGGLARLVGLLADAHAVVPQNYFCPLPWHARWDTARTLLNRAVAHDYPGTLAVRRSAVAAAGGYDGDVMFENLELLRTLRAAGGVVRHAPDLFVRRLPPTAAHFRGQRVRQAYDSLAQPARYAAELAVLPALLVRVRRRGAAGLVEVGVAAVALAEVGRRRHRGRAVFPASTSLWAPAWVAERAVCAWLAIGARARGGVRYGHGRLRRAATSSRVLRRRLADVHVPSAAVDGDVMGARRGERLTTPPGPAVLQAHPG